MLDKKGFIWISTNHGLFKASLSTIADSAYEKDLDEIYFHYFDKKDGLVSTEFNGGCQPCAIKLEQWFVLIPPP